MKFRFYQLYFLLSAVLLVVAMCGNVAEIIEPSGATYDVGNFAISKPDGVRSYAVVALGVVLVAATLVNAFGLLVSLFNNFELQKRTSILSMLLITGYYVLLLLFILLLLNDASLAVKMEIMFPFISLVLGVLSFLSARRTEAAILAKATGFRLRD